MTDDLYSNLRHKYFELGIMQSYSDRVKAWSWNRAVSGDDPGESGKYKIGSIKMSI